jgi:hypothetical protein
MQESGPRSQGYRGGAQGGQRAAPASQPQARPWTLTMLATWTWIADARRGTSAACSDPPLPAPLPSSCWWRELGVG